MDEHPPSLNGQKHGTLAQPGKAGQREVMRQWQRAESGMDGERAGLPETPDDPVASKLLDAAGDAMGRGEWQQGINILRLAEKFGGRGR